MIVRRIPRVVRAGLIAVALAALLASCFSPARDEALRLLNQDRTSRGIPALGSHGQLDAKAQAWAERLARENRLYHSNLSSGITACWRSLGENVGYGSSVAQVQAAFMNSSGHRANILNRSFDRVGVGVAYNGGRVYTVQVFMDAC
jgi:uncharacterized protein YkwD